MKNLGLGILIFLFVLGFSGIAAAVPNQASDVAKEKASALEKIEFIHYKKDFVKPDQTRGPKTESCYKLLRIEWKSLPVGYVINPTNPQNLNSIFIENAVQASAETWDIETSKELMNDSYAIDSTAAYGVLDSKNSIVFGDYPTDGVIAVTSIWRNPAIKAIAEFDIMLNTDYTWGDAVLDPSVMDLQSIATHELGHGIGLADIYTSSCSEVTMYGYSNNGETEKRTLESPDITGLRKIYGI